jgi:D12 class N6 adenine-specific DNA methyltransferase
MTATKPIKDDRTTSRIHESTLPGAPRDPLSAPFPYFGGKSRIAPLIWQALGDPRIYVEPFFGSGATLLARPASEHHREVINDKDGFVANFWRAIQQRPKAVARWANWPSNEIDLQARQRWLCDAKRKARFVSRMRRDPDYTSAKIAGWWVWGISQWIGGGWCAGVWHGDGDARNRGSGITGQRRSTDSPKGIFTPSRRESLRPLFERLSNRLRTVRVMCGDWHRIFSDSNLRRRPAGIFLDPPYDHSVGRATNIYTEDLVSTADVRAFCFERGKDPTIRIVLAGYDGEYRLPGWKVIPWSAGPGMARSAQGVANRERERLWLSPGCILTADLRRHVRTWRRRSDAADPRPTAEKHRPDRKSGPAAAPHKRRRRTSGARAPARGTPRAVDRTPGA